MRGPGISESVTAGDTRPLDALDAVSTGDGAYDSLFEGDGLVGRSRSFLRVASKIPLLANSDATVLITGETGTGKELFAHAIHNHSKRTGKPFMPVNCGALPEHLTETVLFGHAKGAYTGAAGSGKGLLAEAEGGTLFLDELNSLNPSAQSKLLRFLQSREYRMLGSTKLLRADVRILAATNVDLRRQVQLNLFREDLYHRLYVLAIELPPLRERAEDIPLLAQHFLDLVTAEQGGPSARLTPDAALKMQSYDWSGNVRELQSVVQRSYLLSGGARRLDAGDIDLPGTGAVVLTDRRIALPPIPSRSEFSAPERDFAAGDSENTTETFREAKDRVIRGFESGYIRDVLVRTRGNVTRAAKLAGMQRRDFQRLMRKHDLSVSDFLP